MKLLRVVGGLFVIAAFLSACDSTDANIPSETSSCLEGPQEGEVDFLPLQKGDTWSYAYRHESSCIYCSRLEFEGSLDFEIEDSRCDAGVLYFQVTQTLSGIRREERSDGTGWDSVAVNTTEAITFIEDSSGVRLPPWSVAPLRRYHPEGTDTVFVQTEGLCGWLTQAELVRGEGLVRLSASISRLSTSCSAEMELL